jgi:hypothetical protein
MRPALVPLALLVVAPTLGHAVDLSKIDRTIAKEPAYRTATQRYCLLIFGPEAKTRVWLVMDGDDLYVDRNGNGDLTEPGEKQPVKAEAVYVEELFSGDGDSPYRKFMLRRFGDHFNMTVAVRKRTWYAGWDTALKFATKASEAPIVHFDGPLTFRLDNPGQFVERLQTQGAATLSAFIGTPGLGAGTFARPKAREFKGFGPPLAQLRIPAATPDGPSRVIRFNLEPDG